MKKTNLIRDEANGISLVFLAMSATIIICLIFVLVNQVSNLEAWQDIENCAHRTLLQIEQDGYFTQEAQDVLTAELQEIGVSNISYAGSSFSPAGYGNATTLIISGTITMFANPFEDGSLYDEKTFVIEKQISSKSLEEVINP